MQGLSTLMRQLLQTLRLRPKPATFDFTSLSEATLMEKLLTIQNLSYQTKILKTKRAGVIYRITVLDQTHGS